MARFFYSIWTVFFLTVMAATGCATQFKALKGISRTGYSIQVGAFAEVNNAERLTSTLQKKGIDAFYFKKDNGYYAVHFGDYPSRESAVKDARMLIDEKLISAYFISSPGNVYLHGSNGTPHGQKLSRKSSDRDMGSIAARTAERFVGIPYQWGGVNVVDGMDCSGFVRAVYNLCGVNIPRTSREQFLTGDNVEKGGLKEGDLVFFGSSDGVINHVGIYVGNSRFVHAPRRGEEIKVSSLDDSYFNRKFVGARRYF